jgi:hypothetical protein
VWSQLCEMGSGRGRARANEGPGSRLSWRARLVAGWWSAVVGLLLLVGCSPAVTTVTMGTSARSAFNSRLQSLSANPVIQQAAQYRLGAASVDPRALTTAVAAGPAAPETVRPALDGEVDEVVIVDWLVSFGSMGAWTAYNPRNPETVNIPVSDIPALSASRPDDLEVFLLRDGKHLMLVRPVVVGNQAVGAVGFILTETYKDPALSAEAVPLS